MNSQTLTTSSTSVQPDTRATQPFSPSFIDTLIESIRRLPIPYGLTYLAFFTAQVILAHLLAWLDGWLPAYTFAPILLLFPMWLWGPLAIITYLNSISVTALSTFAPLLNAEPETVERLRREFTTMPARNVLISGIVWSIVYLFFTFVSFDALYEVYRFGSLFAAFLVFEGLVSYFAGSVIYYHTVRQIRLVNRAVKMISQLDLFRLDPVYAFSIVTSRTGIAWVLLVTLTLLVFPIQLALAATFSALVLQVVLALSAFALPLRAVNLLLVSEKRRLLAEHNRYVESTLERLHRDLDNHELVEAAQLKEVILGLNAERDILEKIPTWPWRPGLLTGFLSVIVLPVILFLIQLVIGRWLGQ